jgi:sigma-54 dependent transcriptional regulator, acetoin dehydrogenase operon transcriptional activator AcoR
MWEDNKARNTALRDPLAYEVVRLCRQQGFDEPIPLPGVVEESWKRCLDDYNLLPDKVPRAAVLTHSELRELIGSSEELLRIAEPEVERLFLQLVDSEYLVSFASPQGVMLLFRCDYQYLGEMSASGVLPGSIWSEERQGTNGVGTALRLGKSVSIVGKQHYGTATKSLTCITAPLLGAHGSIEGVINVTTGRSGDARMNRVVQSIVEGSARRIENRYFGSLHRRSLQLRLMANVDSADLAEEGRLAIDEEGRIVATTSHVSKLTGAPLDGLIGSKVEDVLDLEVPLSQMRPGTSNDLVVQNHTIQAMLTVPDARTELPAAWRPVAPPVRRSFASVSPLNGRANFVEKGLRIDPVISQALDRAQRLLKAGLSLIIFGETGTGKTVFAETAAGRCFSEDSNLIVIDCAVQAALNTSKRSLTCGHEG